ncbi:MAG: hypothetical protein SGI90_06685 [Candidatus Eisenbacteria bacterium]|nr:hypothetical protein [Candidatus Eisenbacteria bacterium]
MGAIYTRPTGACKAVSRPGFHIFDPVTFVELDAAHLSPNPGDKIVDLEFRRFDVPVPVQPSTWSRIIGSSAAMSAVARPGVAGRGQIAITAFRHADFPYQ